MNIDNRTRYINSLPDLTNEVLLDELTGSILQNSYGSHEDQIGLVRAELLRRMGGAR